MSRWMIERCTEMQGGAGEGAPASTDAIRDSSRAFQVPALAPRATAGGPVGRAAGTGRAPRGAAAPHPGAQVRPAAHLKQTAVQLKQERGGRKQAGRKKAERKLAYEVQSRGLEEGVDKLLGRLVTSGARRAAQHVALGAQARRDALRLLQTTSGFGLHLLMRRWLLLLPLLLRLLLRLLPGRPVTKAGTAQRWAAARSWTSPRPGHQLGSRRDAVSAGPAVAAGGRHARWPCRHPQHAGLLPEDGRRQQPRRAGLLESQEGALPGRIPQLPQHVALDLQGGKQTLSRHPPRSELRRQGKARHAAAERRAQRSTPCPRHGRGQPPGRGAARDRTGSSCPALMESTIQLGRTTGVGLLQGATCQRPPALALAWATAGTAKGA